MIKLDLKCPYCNESLMNTKLEIDNKPSVEVKIVYKRKAGKLNLSAVYGSYNLKTKLNVPEGEIAKFYCPHCDKELKSSSYTEYTGGSAELAFSAIESKIKEITGKLVQKFFDSGIPPRRVAKELAKERITQAMEVAT